MKSFFCLDGSLWGPLQGQKLLVTALEEEAWGVNSSHSVSQVERGRGKGGRATRVGRQTRVLRQSPHAWAPGLRRVGQTFLCQQLSSFLGRKLEADKERDKNQRAGVMAVGLGWRHELLTRLVALWDSAVGMHRRRRLFLKQSYGRDEKS